MKISKASTTKDTLNKLCKQVKMVIIKLGSEGYIIKDGENYYQEGSISANFKEAHVQMIILMLGLFMDL